MGIYDRDYYREDTTGRWSNWRSCRVTIGLIGVICTAFLFELPVRGNRGEGPVLQLLGFDADRVLAGEVWRLLTSHVVHGGSAILQVAVLSIGLYVVGSRVEGVYGNREFLAYILVAALAISAVKLLAALGNVDRGMLTYGAGGLVTAVLILYACQNPHERVNVIVPVPIWGVAATLVLLDLVGEFGGGLGHAGHVAHLTGAAIGVGYYAAGVRFSNVLFPRWLAGPARRRVAAPKLFVDPAAGAPAEPAAVVAGPSRPRTEVVPTRALDEQLEAKLDQVLEKVSRTGRDSLTTDEQDILRQASEVFKRRREK